MAKLILYTAISLDGYIATQDGGIDWLNDDQAGEEDYGYQEFLDGIGSCILGRSTYNQLISWGEWPYPDKKSYVLTSNPSSFSSDVAVALKEPILSHFAQIKEQSKEDIWLIGGGKANALFLDAGLIDEFIFTYIPKTLGKGIRIFEGDADLNSYTLVEHKFYPNGVFQIRFELKN